MPDRVLLTEKREQVLAGEYEGTDEALRNQKSRLRKSSRIALDELIQVAESPHIDNTDVFDTDQVARLLNALFIPDAGHVEGGGLDVDPRRVDTNDLPTADCTDEFQQFRDSLYVAVDRPMRSYRDSRYSRIDD